MKVILVDAPGNLINISHNLIIDSNLNVSKSMLFFYVRFFACSIVSKLI